MKKTTKTFRNKIVGKMTPESVNVDLDAMPKYILEPFLRAVIEMTKRNFEDPAFRQQYEQWKAEKEKNNGIISPNHPPNG